MRIREGSLALALAVRLKEVVPVELETWAEGGNLVIGAKSAGWSRTGLEDILESDDVQHPSIETALWAGASAVQDFVAEFLALPWPGSGGAMPLPRIQREPDRFLVLWTLNDDVVLSLRPILYSDLQ
jgi:hypothetical protein